MTKDHITHGETYTLTATAQDADGVALVMDGTWAAACRFTSRALGGATVENVSSMTIAAGSASHSIATGDAPWAPGVYVYDIRLTDPQGNDFWCAPVQLTIKPRNTPPS